MIAMLATGHLSDRGRVRGILIRVPIFGGDSDAVHFRRVGLRIPEMTGRFS
jgi:hypothetical protein